MPLEAAVIVLDNSEYMRNGDYAPTRFTAQGEAATTVFDVKVNSNPENTVGVMTMAGKGCANFSVEKDSFVLTHLTLSVQKSLSPTHAKSVKSTPPSTHPLPALVALPRYQQPLPSPNSLSNTVKIRTSANASSSSSARR